MADIAETLRNDFRDIEFAEVYADSFLDSSIATQIKVLREQRQMTQQELAEKIGSTQTVISRIERVDYSSWSLKTLKKLAAAFRVRLRVSFETYGTLIGEIDSFGRGSLKRPAHEDDPLLADSIDERDDELTDVDISTEPDSTDHAWQRSLDSVEPRMVKVSLDPPHVTHADHYETEAAR